jgi:hypothetical protein
MQTAQTFEWRPSAPPCSMAAAETHRTVCRTTTLPLPPRSPWPLASMHRSLFLRPPLFLPHTHAGRECVCNRCRVWASASLTTRRRGAPDLCPSSPLSSGADSAPRPQRPLPAESCDLHLPRWRVSLPTTLPHTRGQGERGGPWAYCFAVGLSRHTY